MSEKTLTHQDAEGRVRMVDVSAKRPTSRTAIAAGEVSMSQAAFDAVRAGQGPKGDALATAELAGIMAAKKTSDLIPLCHPLPLASAKVSIEPIENRAAFEVRAEVRTTAETGVEMEALTAVSVACLTLYDMAKALDKTMTISNVRLLKKTGGKSGDFVAQSQA